MIKSILNLCIIFFSLVSFLLAQEPGEKIIIIDSMESNKNWSRAADKNSSLELDLVKGLVDNALEMSYDLTEGTWVEMAQDIKLDLSNMDEFQFSYYGFGDPNFLELKLWDKDGSVYGYRIPRATLKNDWTTLKILKSDLFYFWGGNNSMDWKNVVKISFAISRERGKKGRLVIDNIQYKMGEKIIDITEPSTAVPIDNFERSDPYRMYQIIVQDQSLLALQSSRQYQVEGNYSMEMDYSLSTKRSYPSFVQAIYEKGTPVNWTGVKELYLSIRGDSTRNVFRINVYDADDEIWTFDDTEVLYYNDWREIIIPIEKFKLASWSKKRNKKFDLEKIIRYEFMIQGQSTENSTGKIYIDKFFVKGKDLVISKVTPPEVVKGIELERPQGNIDFKGNGIAEYSYIPEFGNRMFLIMKLIGEARVGKFSAYLELSSESVPFGKDSFPEKVSYEYYLRDNKAQVEISAVRLGIKDPFTFINDITIGSIRENFSDYTFSQWNTRHDWDFEGFRKTVSDWDYKGVRFNGKYTDVTYRGMLIKKLGDSFVGAGEGNITIDQFSLKGIYVYDSVEGHIPNTGALNQSQLDAGILGQNLGNFINKQVYIDEVYNLELRANFKQLKLGFTFGEDRFTKFAEGIKVPLTGPMEDFEYSYKLTNTKRKKGNFYKAEIEIRNVPLEEFVFNGYYRVVDDGYKPTYRANPNSFDELWSNVKGFHFRISQGWNGWVPSFEMDQLQRKVKSSTNFGRSSIIWGIDKYGLFGFDLGFSQELRDSHRDKYNEEDRFYGKLNQNPQNKKEKVLANTFRIAYNISSTFRITEEARFENIEHLDDNSKHKSQRFYTYLDYNITGNAKFKVEYVYLKYGEKTWEPQNEPFDDNFFRSSFELTF